MNRISFQGKENGLDLSLMIDSFKNMFPQYQIPDSIAVTGVHGNTVDCQCCCIQIGDEIYFSGPTPEIYRINIERHTYNEGKTNQYVDDMGYIDIVSIYKKEKWDCKLTSKLNKIETQRIKNRFYKEVITKLPTIKLRLTLKQDN